MIFSASLSRLKDDPDHEIVLAGFCDILGLEGYMFKLLVLLQITTNHCSSIPVINKASVFQAIMILLLGKE